ncbi:outer membrane beta-barrel protein [Methylobacterium soli]|uniref:Outer membrane beta-barrel protein n=1 Tax=Methylobacterium soli TaxID=553447 RepID=A0A6L3SY71_9HYPH|nr:outer membrane beta-barrel protein [Methylobacterium soli]
MRSLLVALPIAGLTVGVLAADLPRQEPSPAVAVPLFTWSGAYSGLFAGAGGFENRTSPVCIGADGQSGGLACPIRSPSSRQAGDFIAGSEIGYDHQVTPESGFIVGAAADYQFTPIRSYSIQTGDFRQSGVPGAFFPEGIYHAGQRLDWLATARAKVGYAFDRVFLYATGGVALGDVRIDTNTTANAGLNFERVNRPDFDGRKGNLRIGYVAGGGVEYAISPHLSAKGEILYYDLGDASVISRDASGRFPRLAVGSRAEMSGVLGRVGLNYRFNNDGLPFIGPITDVARALADPAAYVPPVAQVWDFEIGTRYLYSSGSVRKSLYRPIDQTMISRLTYRDFDAHSGETFARLEHNPTGLFAKGFLGSGFVTSGGRLNDEDFPPIRGNIYSNTISKIRTGDIALAAVDAGYSVLRDETYKLGAFLGYQYYAERANGNGCVQIATNPSICPREVPNSILGLTQDNHWHALRVGLAGEARYDRFKVSLEGAYLPVAALAAYDRHWLRPEINAQPEHGNGNGYFLEGVISYDLTPVLSVGVGARYWQMSVGRQNGTARFPDLTEPAKFSSGRYGAFAQISYRFTDPDLGPLVAP